MDIFYITPVSSRSLFFLGVLCVLMAIMFLLFAHSAYWSRNCQVHLSDKQLEIVGDLWSRVIKIDRVNFSNIQLLDLYKADDYALKFRTLGLRVPGYSSGWHRLRNGEKALVYITNRHEVIYIPTYDGYSLLLSIENPNDFMSKLNEYSN
ncbi:MAG: PH domain-containing protein [Candidatus Thiodiazotropha taylori]